MVMNNIKIVNIPGMDLCSVNFITPIGSASEPVHLHGITHLIEHLFFRSHPKLNHYELFAEIEKKGGIFNAMNEKDMTSIYGRVHKSHINSTLKILYDIVNNFEPRQEDIKKEKQIINIEMAPQRFIFFKKMLFDSHNILLNSHVYGRTPYENDNFKNITKEDIMNFYSKYMNINNWCIVIVGDISYSEIDIGMSWEYKPIATSYKEPHRFETGTITRENNAKNGVIINIPFKGNVIDANLMENILFKGLSAPFYSKIIKENTIAYSLYTHVTEFLHFTSLEVGWQCSLSNTEYSVDIAQDLFNNLQETYDLNELIGQGIEKTITQLFLQKENFGRLSRSICKNIIFSKPVPDFIEQTTYLRSIDSFNYKSSVNEVCSSPKLIIKYV
jgi:predicted Zn-dependent peptidase